MCLAGLVVFRGLETLSKGKAYVSVYVSKVHSTCCLAVYEQCRLWLDANFYWQQCFCVYLLPRGHKYIHLHKIITQLHHTHTHIYIYIGPVCTDRAQQSLQWKSTSLRDVLRRSCVFYAKVKIFVCGGHA